MKVRTTNFTSLPLLLAVVKIRTREIAVQVRDRTHSIAHEQKRNDKTSFQSTKSVRLISFQGIKELSRKYFLQSGH